MSSALFIIIISPGRFVHLLLLWVFCMELCILIALHFQWGTNSAERPKGFVPSFRLPLISMAFHVCRTLSMESNLELTHLGIISWFPPPTRTTQKQPLRLMRSNCVGSLHNLAVWYLTYRETEGKHISSRVQAAI